jgi:hypothetical protein
MLQIFFHITMPISVSVINPRIYNDTPQQLLPSALTLTKAPTPGFTRRQRKRALSRTRQHAQSFSREERRQRRHWWCRIRIRMRMGVVWMWQWW